MIAPSWRGLVVAVLTLASCRVNLPLPEARALSCRSNRDCPQPQRCAQRVSLCFATLDDTPPTLVNLSAIDATTVAMSLSERISPVLASQVHIYGAQGNLAIVHVELDDIGATLIVHTDPQVPSQGYLLSIDQLVDEQGNSALFNNLPFDGFGTADSAPPAVLGPAVNEIAVDLTTVLRWAKVAGARQYEVQVAADSAFTQPIPGSPFTTTESSLPVTFTDAITYHWRVRADVTQSGSTVGSTVEALWHAIYVYCAEGADCSAEAGVEIGNKTKPYRSLTRGMAAARALGIGRVVIAGRGGAAAYDESLFYTAGGVNLLGGYDPTFAVNDLAAYPTRLSPQSIAHRIAAVTVTTLIDGLEFHRQAGAADATLNLTGNTNALTLSRIVVGARSTGMARAVAVSGDASTGPLLDDVTIVADQPLAGGFLALTSGPASWRHLHIDVTATGLLFGLAGAGLATLDVADSDIRLRSAGTVNGIAVGKTPVQLARSTIDVATSTLGARAIAVSVSDGVVDISRTTLRAEGGDAAPLDISLSELATITNSVLTVGGGPASSRVGARLASVVEGYVFNNTILVESGAQPADTLEVTGGAVQFVNNALACAGQPGLSLSAAVVATRVDNNVFVECTPLQRDTGDTTNIATLNGLANHQNNVGSLLTVAAAFTSSGAPTLAGGTEFATLGTTLSSCIADAPCVTNDLEGRPRTAPYCAGAFEIEP